MFDLLTVLPATDKMDSLKNAEIGLAFLCGPFFLVLGEFLTVTSVSSVFKFSIDLPCCKREFEREQDMEFEVRGKFPRLL